MQINCEKSFSFCQVFLWLLNVKERLPRQSPTLSGLDGYITLAHGERPHIGDVGPHTSPRCAHLHPDVATARPRMPTTPPRCAHETSTCIGGRSRDCGWTAKMPGYGCPRKANCTATLRPRVLLRMPTSFQAHPRNASRCQAWTRMDGQSSATLGGHAYLWAPTKLLTWRPTFTAGNPRVWVVDWDGGP